MNNSSNIIDVVGASKSIICDYNVNIVKYNEDLSFEDNLKYALKNYPGVVVLSANQKYNLIWAMWEYGIELMPDEILLVFAIRKSTKKSPGNLSQSDVQRVMAAEKYTGIIV